MKALVLGCGSIGMRHIGHLRRLGVARVEAADPDPIACERARKQHGIFVRENPEEALVGLKPDIVLICTPADTHVPMAIKALEAGAHVFVEKPLSTTLRGIEPLIAKGQEDGRIVQVGYQLRYHPAMKATKRILESGRLGKILSAHAEFGLYLKKWWPDRDYRSSYMATVEKGGGLLLDVSHEIDLMIFFLGGVREVMAYGRKGSGLEIQGFDTIKILMKMENTALVSLSMDCLQPTYSRGFALVGEGSALRWDCPLGRADRSAGNLEVCDAGMDDFQEVPLEGECDSYLEELRDFLSSVSTGKPPEVDLKHGQEVLRVIEAIQRSMEANKSVRVDECR